MKSLLTGTPLAACLTLLCAAPVPAYAQQSAMTFFVTSVGPGKGADLGGLAGADQHCQTLAAAVGAGSGKTWRAYLSTQGAGAVITDATHQWSALVNSGTAPGIDTKTKRKKS